MGETPVNCWERTRIVAQTKNAVKLQYFTNIKKLSDCVKYGKYAPTDLHNYLYDL